MFGVFLNPDLCHLSNLCHLSHLTSCQGISSVLAYTKPLKSQVGTCFTESNPKGPARRTRFPCDLPFWAFTIFTCLSCLTLSPSISSRSVKISGILWISNLGLWLRSVAFYVFFPRLCPSDFVRRSCNGLWCSKRFARCSVRCGDLPFFSLSGCYPLPFFSCLIKTLIDLLWIVYLCHLCRNYLLEIIVYFRKTAAFPNKASNWSILIILADLEHLGGPVICVLTAARSRPKVAQQRPFGCFQMFPASQCGHLAHFGTSLDLFSSPLLVLPCLARSTSRRFT